VFQTKSGASRVWDEIRKHHRYLIIFSAEGENSESVRMLTGIHLLTVQTMLIFVMAICYDIQFPRDTGECATYDTESKCLAEKSIFDPSTSLCRWKYDESSTEPFCEYVTPNFSLRSSLVIAIVVSIISAAINFVVDFLFIDVLSAPNADTLKMQARESVVTRVVRRASNVGQRVSAVSAESVDAIRKRLSMFQARKDSVGSFEIATTKVVPVAASDAHYIATASVSAFMDSAKEKLKSRYALSEERRRSSVELQQKKRVEKHRQTLRDRVNAPVSKKEKVAIASTSSGDLYDLSVADTMVELEVDIASQRRLLKRTQQEGFDELWGVDPTGEFSKQYRTGLFCLPFPFSAESAIKKEIKFVKQETHDKFEKLRYASDVHTGIELLHLFVKDLLGRDSPAAKIWAVKCDEE
jgi:hypothetical protein